MSKTSRISCKTPGCTCTILHSEGLCSACINAAKSRAEEEKTGKVQPVDEFEGVTDPVEIIQISYRAHRFDPHLRRVSHPIPLEDVYSNLTQGELI